MELISRGLCVPIVSVARISDTDYNRISATAADTEEKVTSESSLQKYKKKPGTAATAAVKLWLTNKRILNRYSKIQMRHKSFKSLHKNSLIRFKHKSLSANYLTDRYCKKFVLPSRSLHSARVIKPNKRFVEHEKNGKSKEAVNCKRDEMNCGLGAPERKGTTPFGKVIIREARLNITCESGITGPFSAKKVAPVDKG